MKTGPLPFGPTNKDYLWEIQCRIIAELAEKGPYVIVGRCADYILRDKAAGIIAHRLRFHGVL